MQSVFPKEILNKTIESLKDCYSIYEAESLAYIILQEVHGLTKTNILTNETVAFEESKVNAIVNRLLKNEPIQYILGYTNFFGRKFHVNEDVLIPRQETEELVQLIKSENMARGLRILDIGTGSGCIACSLFLEMNDAEVFAIDVSKDALRIAEKNTSNLNCNVSLNQVDILSQEISWKNLDIIVSNPPYVTNNEKTLMHSNVLEFEPELALFVPNENPLLFYSTITKKSQATLNKGGKLYFEINELFGKEVALLMEENQFENVKIHKDLNGKDRFVSGSV